jgi:hypothetical protein
MLGSAACKTVERYPETSQKFTLNSQGILVAAQDRVSGNIQTQALYRKAAGAASGSIHILQLMPAPALELPKSAASLALGKNGTQGLDPMAELALKAILKAGSRFGVRFEYILFVTAEKAGAVGPVTNVDHYAALYHIESKRVVGAAKITGTTTDETAADQLPRDARKVVALLLTGSESQ